MNVARLGSVQVIQHLASRRSIVMHTMTPNRGQTKQMHHQQPDVIQNLEQTLNINVNAPFIHKISTLADTDVPAWFKMLNCEKGVQGLRTTLKSSKVLTHDFNEELANFLQGQDNAELLAHPKKEEIWSAIKAEAARELQKEPNLASFLCTMILANSSLEQTLAAVLTDKLSATSSSSEHLAINPVQMMNLLQEAYTSSPGLLHATVSDLICVRERDPACFGYSQALLYFKGFQALQSHRFCHWLWRRGRKTLALATQSRVSAVSHIDIHPGASIGQGVLLDHGTGISIGETAVIGNNVSLLHRVCLGENGVVVNGSVRHPHIQDGTLLGAGVIVMGPVVIGAGSKLGAGSIVLTDLPDGSVAVGNPAKVIRRGINKPGTTVVARLQVMDQGYDFIDYEI